MQSPEEEIPPLILLIENDEGDVFLFRRALSKMGYRGDLRVVGSVSEARAYMENSGEFTNKDYFRTPDLIVSDFRLNGPTALEFVQWLRNTRFANLPIVILSGTVRASELPRLNEVGVKEVIYKDPDVALLAARLEALLSDLLLGLFTIGLINYAA